MDKGDKKDFKAVKVSIKGSKNESTLSRGMLYSGVNIFGQLSNLYLHNRDEFNATVGSKAAASAPSSSAVDTSSGGASADVLNLPQEVIMIFKRIQKKDATTRCKAFSELDTFLESIESKCPFLQNLVTFFLYHYCRILVNEADKQVREAAQRTLGSFIKRGAYLLADHMGKVFPIWFCSFFDSAPEVASLARENWRAAMSQKSKKQQAAPSGGDEAVVQQRGSQVFRAAFKYFLHFADEQLRQSEE